MLVSVVQQSESAISIHISPCFGFPSHLSHHRAQSRVPWAIQSQWFFRYAYTCVSIVQTKIQNTKWTHKVLLYPVTVYNPPEENQYSDSYKHPLASLQNFSKETKENSDGHLTGNCFSVNLPTAFVKYKCQSFGAKILRQIFKPFLSEVPPPFLHHALRSLFLQNGLEQSRR